MRRGIVKPYRSKSDGSQLIAALWELQIYMTIKYILEIAFLCVLPFYSHEFKIMSNYGAELFNNLYKIIVRFYNGYKYLNFF